MQFLVKTDFNKFSWNNTNQLTISGFLVFYKNKIILKAAREYGEVKKNYIRITQDEFWLGLMDEFIDILGNIQIIIMLKIFWWSEEVNLR